MEDSTFIWWPRPRCGLEDAAGHLDWAALFLSLIRPNLIYFLSCLRLISCDYQAAAAQRTHCSYCHGGFCRRRSCVSWFSSNAEKHQNNVVTQTDIDINLMTRGCRSTISSASRRETADDDTCDHAKYNIYICSNLFCWNYRSSFRTNKTETQRTYFYCHLNFKISSKTRKSRGK